MDGQEHRLQQLGHVVVGPCRRIGVDSGNCLRPREISTTKPDIYSQLSHVSQIVRDSRSASPAVSVAGSEHVKSWNTYAVARPSRMSIDAMNGSRRASSDCDGPGCTGTITLNGSYFATASRISASVLSSPGSPTMTTCATPA